MRFGKTLRTSIYPPWKDHYIDYSKLKKLLREDDSSPSGRDDAAQHWTDEDEEAFVHELINIQLDKVNSFQVDTYKSLRDRTAECEAKLDPVAATVNSGKETLKEHENIVKEVNKELDNISEEINRLRKFSRINYTGFLKAVKKHDRKRGLKYRVRPLLQVRLSQLPFNTEDYSPLLYRLSTMYTFVRSVTQSSEETSTETSSNTKIGKDSYIAHKFWVHADNLLEVKTYILRRLPVLVYNPQSAKGVDSVQKDPAITSIYFDNPSFDLYGQKIDKKEGASSLRLRWTGQLNDKPEIHFEKKVVGQESKEMRFPIKEKYIMPFLKGEYNLEKTVSKVQERDGPDSEQVKALRSNISEIKEFIKENRLEPMLRASYTRTAFQIPGDDRIRISLDTDLALIREDSLDSDRPCRDPEEWHRREIDDQELEYPYSSIKKGEIARFPHAILEIKVRNTTNKKHSDWLEDLMSSHLVKEAPRFSKFVHGVAQLFEDYVNTFPFWLSDLDMDIRQDPEQAFALEQERQARRAEEEFAVGSMLGTSKLSASPSFQAKVGSPHKFSSDTGAGLSQSRKSVGTRSQLQQTVEEHDSDDDGLQAMSASQIEVTDASKPSALKSLFPTFSTSRYARRHRQGGSAWEDAALPPGVKDPGVWIKDQGPVRVEAKVWLANQRTFVKWQHISVLLASLSIALYNAAGLDNNIARALAVVYLCFAVFAGVWGWGIYVWRSSLIQQRSGKDFDHKFGPLVVSIGLAIALCLNFGFKYRAVMEEQRGKAEAMASMANRTAW